MAKKIHWTQTIEGKRRLRLLVRKRRKASPPETDAGEEDKIHLLYMLPGLEMAASKILQQIDSIRHTLGQGPWNFKPQEVSNSSSSVRNSNPPPPVQERKKKKRKISIRGRRNIKLALKKRWETYHKERQPEPEPKEKEKKPLSKAQLRAMKANALKARAALKAKQARAK